MPVPVDLSGLSPEELQELITRARDQYFLAENAAKAEAEQRKLRLRSAVSQLQTLLGPEDASAGMGSIRGVLAYGDAIIQENPGQAVVLILKGLEQLTETALDLAKTISE